MNGRLVTWRVMGVIVVLSLAASPAAGQSATNARPSLRTPWGDPDLQGLWTNATITPFERPRELADKQTLSAEEAAAFEKQTLQARDADRREGAGADADLALAYNQFWYDRGTKVVSTRRTSLVTDPPDGRVPSLTLEGQRRADARAAARRSSPADGPEDRPLAERCILWPTAGPPMLPSGYNNNYQVLQTPAHVVILIEMIHDVRIIPLDGRPHASPNIRQWLGDSRGRWDGNTLVVTTTNYTNKTNFRGASEHLRLTERFTRVDAETINYEFTVDDPTTFTKPWTAAIPMTKAEGPIFEYACHEGNYGMTNLLSGARTEEKDR